MASLCGRLLTLADELVLFDGRRWSVHRATVSKEGTLKYGAGEVAMENCETPRPGLHVLCASPAILADEAQFHKGRRRLGLAALFSPAGDFVEILRWVGWAVIVVACLWSVNTVSGQSAALGKLSGQVQAVQAQLAKPISIEVPRGTTVVRP
jgi:hypothetical protein